MKMVHGFELQQDLQSWPLFTRDGIEYYLVGSVEADRYLVVDEARYPIVIQILELLREGVSVQEIEARLAEDNIQTNVEKFVELGVRKYFWLFGYRFALHGCVPCSVELCASKIYGTGWAFCTTLHECTIASSFVYEYLVVCLTHA